MDFKTPEEDVDEPEVNINDSYKEMLTMMKPGETVITALKRLGNKGKKQKSMSLSERLKAKKLQKPQVEDSNEITSEMNDSISDSGQLIALYIIHICNNSCYFIENYNLEYLHNYMNKAKNIYV